MTPTLFDAAARLSDPPTSHAAAKADRSTLELDVLSAVRAAGWVGATTDEAWRAVEPSHRGVRANSVSRRLTTLARRGLIEVCGTRPGESGKQQQVWRSA